MHLSEQQRTLGEKRSRLASLREIARRFEGYSDGVRHLMAEDAATNPWRSQVRGLLSTALRVPPDLERASKRRSASACKTLVVDDLGTASVAIDRLKTQQAGRSGFVPWRPEPVAARGPPASASSAPCCRRSRSIRVWRGWRKRSSATCCSSTV